MFVYLLFLMYYISFFFSSRRRHTRYWRDWSSDVCSSDLDEYYMEYNKDILTNDSISIIDIYRSLSTMLVEHEMGRKKENGQKMDYVLRPEEYGKFDLWQLENSFIKAGEIGRAHV